MWGVCVYARVWVSLHMCACYMGTRWQPSTLRLHVLFCSDYECRFMWQLAVSHHCRAPFWGLDWLTIKVQGSSIHFHSSRTATTPSFKWELGTELRSSHLDGKHFPEGTLFLVWKAVSIKVAICWLFDCLLGSLVVVLLKQVSVEFYEGVSDCMWACLPIGLQFSVAY